MKLMRIGLVIAFMLLALPAVGQTNPLEVSTFCDTEDVSISWLQVTNTSEDAVQVYAYPISGGEGAQEQTIEAGASYLVPGAGPYVVYLFDKKWPKVPTYEGVMAECVDEAAPPPCHECGDVTTTTTIVEDTTSTTVVEDVTTTTAVPEDVAPTTTIAATEKATTSTHMTELPFTGSEDTPLAFTGAALLLLGAVAVRAAKE